MECAHPLLSFFSGSILKYFGYPTEIIPCSRFGDESGSDIGTTPTANVPARRVPAMKKKECSKRPPFCPFKGLWT
jgi:hypothetical protein